MSAFEAAGLFLAMLMLMLALVGLGVGLGIAYMRAFEWLLNRFDLPTPW